MPACARALPEPRLLLILSRMLRQIFTILILLLVTAGAVFSQSTDVEPIETEHFIYYFDNPSYVDGADSVLRIARRRLINLLQDSLVYKPNVHLVGDLGRFQNLVRGRIPDWGAAVAYPPRQRIAVKSPDEFNLGKSLDQLLTHELAHLALAQRTGFHQAPRWFDEGLAQRVSTEWSWMDNLAASKAAIFGQYIPLREIEKMNRFNSSKVQVAYAQSHIAVNYFYDFYGVEAVNKFLDAIAAGESYDKALVLSTGSDYDGFEREFQTHWSSRFNIVTLLADTMWLWLMLALVVVVGAFLKYRKRRQYYRKWEQEEKYQSTDFDYGDPDKPERTDDDEPWRS